MLSASYSSSTSGNWSWDASDQSVPSTPSPPLSNDTNKNFLLSSQCDDVSEDVTESTHFMFEDPIPRKRKVKLDVYVLLHQHDTGVHTFNVVPHYEICSVVFLSNIPLFTLNHKAV